MDNNLERLFHDGLKDIYYAERKILKTLPKMMEAAQDPELVVKLFGLTPEGLVVIDVRRVDINNALSQARVLRP